jgi:hypothetical protein
VCGALQAQGMSQNLDTERTSQRLKHTREHPSNAAHVRWMELRGCCQLLPLQAALGVLCDDKERGLAITCHPSVAHLKPYHLSRTCMKPALHCSCGEGSLRASKILDTWGDALPWLGVSQVGSIELGVSQVGVVHANDDSLKFDLREDKHRANDFQPCLSQRHRSCLS